MTASLSAHLSPELLAALNRGQLPREQRAAVEEHLLNCRRCEEALAGVDEDSFVRRLRGQKSLDTLAPQAVTPGGRRPDSQPALPPALNDHPRYRIERKLGEGGMGAVWLAEHRQMQRQVALKVIHPDVARLPAFVERFRREVQAAARLDHPNVVRALDAEEAGGAHFLVMEYVEGIHLGEYARRCGGKVSATLATRVVAQAAVGLQHAHDNGMVHRDIKPHNLLLDRKGRVKVADFGLARCVSELSSESPLTEERSTLGTPDYMSPEQAENPRRADIRSDIYSLGCTLYFLLTGRPPFPEGGHAQKIAAHLSRQPTPLRELVAELPAGLEGVVARAMAKKPAQRYQTPAEFVAALKPFGKKPEPPAPRRRRPLVAVALVLLGLLVFGGVYHIRTSKGELIIETLDDSVEVVIRKNGEQVEIIDTKSKQKLELKAGTYTAEVPGMAGLTVEPQAFTIRRGQEEVVRVRRVVAPVPPRSATPSPTPAAPSVPASATAVTGELTVNTFTDGPQMQARVAVDARGNFVVVWMSREEDGSGWGVVGRRFAATGKPLGAVFPLSVWTQGDQEYPQIAMRPDGGFLTAWHGRGKQGYGVYARLFDAGAKPQGEEVLIAPSSQNRGQVNGVAVDGQGEWLVNWAMLNLRSDGFVRRLDRAGQPKGQAILGACPRNR